MAELITRLKLDGTDFKAGMNDASKSVDNFSKKTNDASKNVKSLDSTAVKSARELLNQAKSIETIGRNTSNYRQQLAQIQRDIADLTITYRKLGDEQNSAYGNEVAAKIQELTQRAAEYKDAITDVQAEITAMSSDTASWDALKQGINVASSSLQAFVSIGVLGEKQTEKLVAVIAKLKAIETATNAVIQIGNALQKNSALMIGIHTIQSKALAAAKKTETTATIAATAAHKAFNIVAKANPYVMLASVILGVAGALVTFCKKNKDAEVELNSEIDSVNAAKDAWDSYWQSIAEQNRNEGKTANEIALEKLNVELKKIEDANELFASIGRDYFAEETQDLEYYNEGLKRRLILEQKIAEERKKTQNENKPQVNPAKEGSVEWLNEQVSATKKLRDQEVAGTLEWIKQNNKLIELNKQLDSAVNYEKASAELLKLITDSTNQVVSDTVEINNSMEKWERKLTQMNNDYVELQLAIEDAAIAHKEISNVRFDNIQQSIGLVSTLSGTFSSLSDALSNPDISEWQRFLMVLDAINTSMTAFRTILSMVDAAQQALTASREKDMAVSAAQAKVAGTEATAETAAAVAKGASSVASIPIVGAVLAVAAAASIVAAIMAASKKAKFATGGIVGGNSYSGDYVNARLNSGEIVINRNQQARLWDFIQGKESVNTTGNSSVEFRIRGDQLYGTLKNYTNKLGKI